MGELRTEPSMEEILASIKRIIADDGLAPNGRGRARAEPAEAATPGPVLELTGSVTPPPAAPAPESPPVEPAVAEQPEHIAAPAPAPPPVAPPAVAARPAAPAPALPTADHTPAAPAALVSDGAASASRHALSALSAMVVRTPGADNTLDGLVREMLKPLLKEWLDQRLPDLVETLVAREIARITDKTL